MSLKSNGSGSSWEVDITPDISLLKKAGQQNYRIPDAIGELIDNEIDARLPGEKLTVKVTIRMGNDRAIVVEGNGSGMTKNEAERAMKMGYSAKGSGLIGEFGLGMKAACSNLGSAFEILTCTRDMKQAISISYSEDEFLEGGEWKIRLRETDKPFEHGTRITISSPRVKLYPGLKDTILSNFGRTFKHFIRNDEVDITVGDELVTADVPKLRAGFTKEFAFEVQGHKVSGWYGLQKTYRTTGGYGFELVRHNRAMLRHEKIGFKPHPRLSRMVGEIHLDDFPVANNKMDFMRDTDLWREFEETFSKTISDIRGIAGQLASRRMDPKDKARIDEMKDQIQETINSNAFQQTVERRGLDQILAQTEESEDTVDQLVPVEQRTRRNGTADVGGDEEEKGGTDDGQGDDGRARTPRVTHQRIRAVKAMLSDIEITHDAVSLGSDGLYKTWDVTGLSPVRLSVGTNVDHPMFAEFGEDFVLWVKHNIVEAVAEHLARESGVHEMLLWKSDILKHIGRITLAEIEEAPTLT